MAYTTLEGRQHLLEQIAGAAEQLGAALAHLGEAHEHLDEHAAERLEEELFRPVRRAYGLAKRECSEFAARHGLPPFTLEPKHPQVLPSDAKGAIDSAVEAVGGADGILAALQDSMLPVEVGDPQLRSAIAQMRQLLGGLREQARQLVRTLGR
jgi:hypothetical protein